MASPALKQLSIENTPKTKEATQAMASIANARNAINAGATPTEARKGLTTPRITPESLQPTPEVKVAPPPIPVQGPALEAGITEQADQFTQNLTEQRKTAEAGKTTALADYINQLKGAQTQSSLEATQYAQAGGVNDITTELNDINNQIRVEQRALENARRRVTESGGGLATGAAAEVANLERVSLQKQADLSIIQMAVQGRYDSAKEIADRAVKAQMEQQNQLLDVLKFNYTENKELFTTAEQREFDTLLANRQREIKAEEDRIAEIKNLSIQALADGAPTSLVKQMMGAKTLDEAVALGGQYVGMLDRQQKYASIRSANANAALNEAELTAFNKAQEDAANGILSPEQMKVANDVNKDFESQPIVKSYNEGLQKYMVLEDTLANGIDGVQDLQLVYDFMKAVDPASVVRETEFANAAKTGNIFQGAYASFNKAFGSGGFLPEQVKQDFIRSARSSFEAKNAQYYNVKSEYTKRMNNTVGTNSGANYLTAYEAAAPLTEADNDIVFNLQGATAQDVQDIMLMTEQFSNQGTQGATIYK